MQQFDKPAPIVGESVSDYRTRVAEHQAERARRRQEELLEQTSMQNTPAMRIRVWERLHQVALPRNPAHRLLEVIAADTDLSIDQVREEQRARLLPPPAAPQAGPAALGEPAP
ncbi:MAG: hypothetical protein IT495_03005 [Gammaproteobacteria bacterium]|nr:hypothetical protein [Gammaproteobacteria bacterium]